MTSGTPQGSGAVLVTGGSGFIGKHLVKRLSAEGETIVSMYHHRLPEPMASVYPVCSDMSSAELIAAPLRGVDTVVHLAWGGNFTGPTGEVDWTMKSGKYTHNITTVLNLIAAMEKAGTRRIIFVSAMGASRKAQTPFLREKYLAEFFILNSRIPEKIILRSTLVCGGPQSDKFVQSVLGVMQYPAFYPVPDAKKTMSPISVDDLALMLCGLVRQKVEDVAAVVEITGQQTYKVEDVFKMISSQFSRGSKIPLKGFLGDSLLPLFERRKKDIASPKIRDYLSLGSNSDESMQVGNPLLTALPTHLRSFQDIVSDGRTE